ncbi:MAG: serine/threonine protein kinase [Deltaproteobacteria bacterium]|nr:serine/threonine protein kinase [Deltaproteobacteria bacterium]
MRPEETSSKLERLEGEELEELIEGDAPLPYAQTQSVDAVLEEQVEVEVDLETSQRRLPAAAQAAASGPVAAEDEPTAAQGQAVPASDPVLQRTGPGRQARVTGNRSRGGAEPSAGSPAPERKRRSRKLDDSVEEYLGNILGSYRIISLLGSGGMGRVFLAEHVVLGRKVALKLLRPEYAVKRDAVNRFFQEARAVNNIRHENIVDVTDLVELESGETFIIMELLEGQDLSDVMKSGDGPLAIPFALQIALQVCDGLQAAHRAGIIHRDMKPDNVYVLKDRTRACFVKLLDFGVAKLQGQAEVFNSWQTAAGSVIGTPAYMSPEQATGIPVDARSDIYSLGAILYELFTGHPVFRARSFGEYVVKHMNDLPVPPRELEGAPRLPVALERVILRCLEKHPDKRFQSVVELRASLEEAVTRADTPAESAPAPVGEVRRGRRGLMLALAGTVVLGLALLAFWVTSGIPLDEVLPQRGSGAASGPEPAPTPRTSVVPPRTPVAESTEASTKPKVEPTATQLAARITVHSEPSGADVFRVGEHKSLGRTPVVLQLPNPGERISLVLRRDGYLETVETVQVADNMVVSVALKARPKGSAERRAKGSARGRGRGKVKEPRGAAPTKGTGPRGPITPEDVVDPFD